MEHLLKSDRSFEQCAETLSLPFLSLSLSPFLALSRSRSLHSKSLFSVAARAVATEHGRTNSVKKSSKESLGTGDPNRDRDRDRNADGIFMRRKKKVGPF